MDGPITPTCPRCGYDLSGLAPTWETQCPIEGVCSECGYAFAWGDVYDETRIGPPWSVETPSIWRLTTKTLRTSMFLASPIVFWNRTKLGHPFRPLRIIAFLLWIPLLLGASLVVIESLRFKTRMAPNNAELVAHVWGSCGDVLRALAYDMAGGRRLVPLYLWLIWTLIVPVSLVAMYATRRTERFRWVHVCRAWLYSFAPFALLTVYNLVRGLVTYLSENSLSGFPRGGPLDLFLRYEITPHARPLLTLWIVIFWLAFFRNHLRLTHWLYATVAVVMISSMLAFILFDFFFMVNPYELVKAPWYWRWDRFF